MPVVSAATPAAEVVLRYRAGEQRLAIGGDFADALALADGRIATIVGDVSGRGPDAAAMGATLRAGWRALVLRGTPLDELPQGLQALLDAERPTPETFVTVAFGELAADGRAIDVSSAGHPPPLVLDARGVHELEPTIFAAPLGVLPRAEGGRSHTALGPGACVLLYSDGLIEGRSAADPSRRFGVAGLRAFLEDHAAVAPLAPGHVLDAALAHATAEHGDELPDDVAMLLIAPRPPRAVSVELAATADRLAAVREIIERVAGAADIARAVIDDARLAGTEACANVVSHAYDPAAPDAGRTMLFEVQAEGDGLVVAVTDRGVGIGGQTRDLRRRPRPAADAQPGHRGRRRDRARWDPRRAALRAAGDGPLDPALAGGRVLLREAEPGLAVRRSAPGPGGISSASDVRGSPSRTSPRQAPLASPCGLDELAEAVQVGLDVAIVDARAPSRAPR